MDKKELIKTSLDARYYTSQIIIMCCILPLMILVAAVGFFAPQKTAALFLMVVLVFIYAAMIGYCVYNLISMRREPDRYGLYQADVLSSHYAFGMSKGAVYLEIAITDEFGERVYLQTKGVFSRSMISERYHGNFIGKSIHILYDRVTDTVLVVDDTLT